MTLTKTDHQENEINNKHEAISMTSISQVSRVNIDELTTSKITLSMTSESVADFHYTDEIIDHQPIQKSDFVMEHDENEEHLKGKIGKGESDTRQNINDGMQALWCCTMCAWCFNGCFACWSTIAGLAGG